MIGDEVYLQRGEIWSLDFEVVDRKGHPLAILNNWKNPYITITVAASLYEQKGDYRETYWLDLERRWVETETGETYAEPLKRFTSTEVLPIDYAPTATDDMGFSIGNVLAVYGTEKGGNIVLDADSDFDVTNFLFFVDPLGDGNYIYAYVESYTLDSTGDITDEVWKEYNFRIIKRFTTRDWTEQGYFYDIKIVAGESVQEHVTKILEMQGISNISTSMWSESEWENYLSMIEDTETREEMLQRYNDGAPLMPEFDTESVLLPPTPIYVSVNLQGGNK